MESFLANDHASPMVQERGRVQENQRTCGVRLQALIAWFLTRLHHFVPRGEYGGHSLQSGDATALALDGVRPELIQATGRWSSDTFQLYIRQHPVLTQQLIQSRLPDVSGSSVPPSAQSSASVPLLSDLATSTQAPMGENASGPLGARLLASPMKRSGERNRD